MKKELGWLSVSIEWPLSHLSKRSNKWVSHYASCDKAHSHSTCFYIGHSIWQMAFTEYGEIWTWKCKVLHIHLPAPQTPGHITSLYSTKRRDSLADSLTSGTPSVSEERLLSYLATATARPVKAKIEFPFTTGLSLKGKSQTVKKRNRDADNKTYISKQRSYVTGDPGGKTLAYSNFTGFPSSSAEICSTSSSGVRERMEKEKCFSLFFPCLSFI